MSRPVPSRIEWPTVLVAAAIYSGFAALTLAYHVLAWWLVLPAAAWLVAWHGSLQHEVVHGHPTPWPALNEALVVPSLWLWLPFRIYRDTHIAHHADPWLTDPRADPESWYVAREQWQRAGRLRRGLHWALQTLAGRVLLGPLVLAGRLLAAEIARLARGNGDHLPAWGMHAAGAGIVIGWVTGVCGIPVLEYVALFALPGIALTQVRSFAEHRAAADVAARTAVVENAGPLGLLFLNNNLHAAHHAHPGVAWYRLPGVYRRERRSLLAANGGNRYRGYRDILRRYALRPRAHPVHPLPLAPTAATESAGR